MHLNDILEIRIIEELIKFWKIGSGYTCCSYSDSDEGMLSTECPVLQLLLLMPHKRCAGNKTTVLTRGTKHTLAAFSADG